MRWSAEPVYFWENCTKILFENCAIFFNFLLDFSGKRRMGTIIAPIFGKYIQKTFRELVKMNKIWDFERKKMEKTWQNGNAARVDHCRAANFTIKITICQHFFAKKKTCGGGIPASPHKERNGKWYNNYVIKIFDKFVHVLERRCVRSVRSPLSTLVSVVPLHSDPSWLHNYYIT